MQNILPEIPEYNIMNFTVKSRKFSAGRDFDRETATGGISKMKKPPAQKVFGH